MSLYIVDIHGELEGDYEEICKYEPCEDAISKQAVFEAIEDDASNGVYSHFASYEDAQKFKETVKALPPVTPIRPKGEWIEIIDEETAYVKTWHYECSECGKNNTCFGGNPNFCPNCGADMRGENG